MEGKILETIMRDEIVAEADILEGFGVESKQTNDAVETVDVEHSTTEFEIINSQAGQKIIKIEYQHQKQVLYIENDCHFR